MSRWFYPARDATVTVQGVQLGNHITTFPVDAALHRLIRRPEASVRNHTDSLISKGFSDRREKRPVVAYWLGKLALYQLSYAR